MEMAEDKKPGASEVDAKPDAPKTARPTPAPGETKGTSAVEARPEKPVKADEGGR